MTGRRAVAAAVVTVVAAVLLGTPVATAAPVAVAGTAAASPARPVPAPGPSTRSCAPATATTVTCYSERRTDIATPHTAAAGPVGGYGPADLRAAYAIPTAGGTGVTVGIVVAYHAPTAAADLATYRSAFGLPALRTGQFRQVDESGGTSYPTFDAGWSDEASLDVQMVTAACPACSIVLVEAGSALLTAMAHASDTAVRLGATYVTNSYGAADTAASSSLAASYARAGVTYVASTGDDGFAAGTAPSFPATAPGVLAVGGTRLVPAGNPRGWSETAWSGAGSGSACSGRYPRPSWQAAYRTGCSGRAVADVAAVADPNTGVATLNSATRGWGVFGGTSAAAPLVAGMAALAGAPGVTASAVYDNPGAFTDVTAGTTSGCTGGALCAAGAGWDGPTGLGTPRGTTGFAPAPASCGGTPAAAASSSPAGGQYVPVTPVRVLDTRLGGGPLGPGGTRLVDLATRLPAVGAAAAVVNVTVTNGTGASFVTAYPAGVARPNASTVNFVPGQDRANAATVALGAVNAGAAPTALVVVNNVATTDVVVDLLGWYTATGDPTAGLTYHPAATASRAVDTRLGPAALGATGRQSRVCVTVTAPAPDGSALTGIGAVAATVTAVNPAGPGFLKAWDGDAGDGPDVSTVNLVPGRATPNAAVIPVSCLDSACSTVTFAIGNFVSAATDVVVDVVGVYAADPRGGLAFRAAAPQRFVDTRTGFGATAPGPGGTAAAVVPGAAAAGAAAVAVNVTAVNPTLDTVFTVYGATRSGTSNLNPVAGDIVAAGVTSGLGSGGVLRVWNAFGRADVVVDLAGWFVPTGS